jgi:hypothetical protein
LDFKFRHLPITSHLDTTAVLEQLQPIIGGLETVVPALEARVTAVESQFGADSGWVEPASFEHAWKAGLPKPFYRRQGNAIRLRGRLESGENGKSAFTLPTGYRPTQQHYQAVIQGGVIVGFVLIEPTGTVALGTAGEAKPSLDGVSFTND